MLVTSYHSIETNRVTIYDGEPLSTTRRSRLPRWHVSLTAPHMFQFTIRPSQVWTDPLLATPQQSETPRCIDPTLTCDH